MAVEEGRLQAEWEREGNSGRRGFDMSRFLPTLEANQLQLEGSLALAEVESAGVRIDKAYLEETIIKTAFCAKMA